MVADAESPNHEPTQEEERKRPRWVSAAFSVSFWLLVAGLNLSVASLMVGHWYTLPKPVYDDPRLEQELWELRSSEERNHLVAHHILYADCACSKRVLSHLFERERTHGVAEKILLIGSHPQFQRRAASVGYELIVLSPHELRARFGLQAAPLLIVADREGKLRYVGGYTERKQGFSILDQEIIQRVRNRDTPVELPLFGCAVSKRLQDIVDPLGFKYTP